jgi:predicted DNA-binding transcriptional regulator AlpA
MLIESARASTSPAFWGFEPSPKKSAVCTGDNPGMPGGPTEVEMQEGSTTSGLTLVRKAELARQLGCSTWTLDRWCKQGKFPRPIYVTDNSPATWRVRDIELWLQQRQVKRRKRPTVRGRLKQGPADVT